MNKIELENKRWLWMTTNMLSKMQESYTQLEKIASVLGDNYVVSGCTINGANVAPGYLVLKGQLMPFAGGVIQENVRIITTSVTKTTTNNRGNYTYTSYAAEFGTSVDATQMVPWLSISKPVEETIITDVGIYGSIHDTYTLKSKVTRIGNLVSTSYVEFSNIQVSLAMFTQLIPAYTLFPFKLANGIHTGVLERSSGLYPVYMKVNNNGVEVTVEIGSDAGVYADNDRIVFHNIHV